MGSTSIAWLRNDLRIADNPALNAATRTGETAVAVYIHETTPAVRRPGAAARWWLHHSLEALGPDLAKLGIALVVRHGAADAVLPALVTEYNANSVFWNRRYGPGECKADAAIKTRLKLDGIGAASFAGHLLVEPWDIATGAGKPYSVFTPFWKVLREMPIPQPLPRPDAGEPIACRAVDTEYVAPDWSKKLVRHWSVGEGAALERLVDFLDQQLERYPENRDFPGRNATSRLSPHLRFGEISVRQIWHAAQAMAHADHTKQAAVDKFLSELAWRDFSYHQLYHRADIAAVPMQTKYARMNWRHAPADLAAWQQGQTGIPIVDAGMRELWEMGYMQNRVRMLVASLLSKNLLVDWRLGEQWFWDCLVDADMANNPASWQWVAGSGLDASPYFRIFNPVMQAGRFDADGDYVRRWVPELARLPDDWLHAPAAAPRTVLEQAGVIIGKTYPKPIVDLKVSRQRALDAAGRLSRE